MIALLLLGLYPYLIYPLIAWGLANLVGRTVRVDKTARRVTVVIAAYNEEECIEETITNKLEQVYPSELLSVIVVSDGSDDGTERIVNQLVAKDRRVRLMRQPRLGKTAGLNAAVAASSSEIIVFADANSIYGLDAIERLVSCFGDSTVGYVTGKMFYGNSGGTVTESGSSAYMKLENWLRSHETRIGSIAGVDGGIDAVRRSLYVPMRDDQLPDFVLPLNVIEQGCRVVYQPLAVLHERALDSGRDELNMRVRVATRAFWALVDHWRLLNPFRTGIFSFQLLSHKWLRYLSFVPLTLALALSIAGYSASTVHKVVAWLLISGIVFAAIGWNFEKVSRNVSIIRFCTYFLLLNAASAFALVRVIRGDRCVTWTPRTGNS